MRLSFQDAAERYGPIEELVWRDEALWCVFYEVPVEVAHTWVNSATGKPVTHIYINRDIVGNLHQAVQNIIARGLVSELKTFDGCFSIRDVRAEPGRPSTHSVACAIDLNASENRLGQEPKLSEEFVKCFKDAGFTWGGDFKRKDGMHFSLAWE